MDGIYELVVGGINPRGQYAENVMHWQITGSGGSDEWHTAYALCTAFNTSLIGNFLNLIGNACVINVMSAKRVDGPGGPTAYFPVNSVGADGGDSCTNAAAIDVAFYPGGALNRPGHLFLWGWLAAHVVGDVINGAFVSTIASWLVQLLATLTVGASGSGNLVVFTKKTKTCTVVTTAAIRPKITGMNKRTKPLT